MTSLPRERQAGRRSSSAYRLSRQSQPLLRPGCFLAFGSIILGVSGLLIFFGPSSSSPHTHHLLAEPAQRADSASRHADSASQHADSASPVERALPRRSLDRKIQEAAMSTGRRMTSAGAAAEGHVSSQLAGAGAGAGSVALRGERSAASRDALPSVDANGKGDAHSSVGATTNSQQVEEASAEGSGGGRIGRGTKEARSGSGILAQVASDGGASRIGTGRNETAGEGGGTTVDFDTGAYGPERYNQMPIRQLPISHEMEDEELLWRASFISLRDPVRRTGPKKIAFLFSFTTQLFFAPLWAKFFDGQEGKFSVYLHGNEQSIDKATLPAVFHHRFVPVETHPSTGDPFPHMFGVDAARRLVANALLDMSNEWFMVVCDLCVPLHTFEYTYNYFTANPNRNFVPHQTPPLKNGQDRYSAACFEPQVSLEQWRKGGPWIGLTRRMALSLVSDVKFYDKFASCCQPEKRGPAEPCFPLEHYLATVLPLVGTTGSSYIQPEEVTNWSIVFEDWWTEPWKGHAFVYNETYVSEKIIRVMRRCHLGNLCHLQGAHFHPSTLRLLMNMTEVLGF